MKYFHSLALAGFLLLAPATLLHAQVQLTPTDDVDVPEGHSFILGLGIRHYVSPGYPDRDYLYVHTTQESYYRLYEGGAGELPGGTTWQKLWDLTQFGLILYEESLAVRDSGNDNLTYFTGGNSGNRLMVWQQTFPAVLSNTPIAQFQSIPQGMVTRASGSGPTEIFYSTAYGNGVDPSGPSSAFAPALIYHPDASNLPLTLTALPENTFGISGPGKVSSGVGALQFGPDGLLNVLDTGDQRIIRYNPDTFEYAGEFALGNTNTDRNTFAISSNGYLFTANLDSAGGSIYNYYTGEFVGTYGATSTFAESGQGGKTSIVADSFGSVIVYDNIGTEEHIYYYDANQLPAAVPEPTIASLLAGSIALVATSSRRRRSSLPVG